MCNAQERAQHDAEDEAIDREDRAREAMDDVDRANITAASALRSWAASIAQMVRERPDIADSLIAARDRAEERA